MKLVAKLHVAFGITLFLPLILAVTFALFYYTNKIEQEAQVKLDADLKVAQLMLQNTVNEFHNLACAYANQKTLAVLVEYKLDQKLDAEFTAIQQADHLDFISILSVKEGLQQLETAYEFAISSAGAGFEVVDSELHLTAAAPVQDRHRQMIIGVLLIRRKLEHTNMMKRISQEIDADVSISTRGISQDRRDYLTNSLNITDTQGEPLATLVVQRSTKAYKHTQRVAILVFIFIGTGGMLLVILFRYLLIRFIIHPILALKNSADRIKNGDYSTRVNFSGYDEIGELGQHFNTMMEHIQTTLHTYNRTKDQLEKIVESRTSELQQKNQQLQEALQCLKTRQVQLLAQEKLASLGELTAGIAHELKNPLNFIRSFSELFPPLMNSLEQELAREHPNQKELRYIRDNLPIFAQKIQEHSTRAVHIINSMQAHARGTKGIRTLTNINRLVKEYIALGYHGMRVKDRSFHTAIQEDYDPLLETTLIAIVAEDFSRVILNIAMNAYHELNRKQKAANDDYAPVLRVKTEHTDHRVVIRIRDNGDGIPKAYREKIFQPFFSTKHAEEGTGLGLSIAYDIVTSIHQGTLDVISQIGEFTEFIIQVAKENPDDGNVSDIS